MAQLTQAFFAKILQMEGGYQDRADDSGNWACGQLIGTNMGVSAVALSDWWGRCPTVQEMKGLSKATAFNFYAWYFDVYRLFEIQGQPFAELLMNNAMGSPAGAARAAQRALNSLGYAVKVDGDMGSATIDALNRAYAAAPSEIYNAVRSEWVKYLHNINKPQFLAGWLYRLDKFFPPMPAQPAASAALYMIMLFLGYKLLARA